MKKSFVKKFSIIALTTLTMIILIIALTTVAAITMAELQEPSKTLIESDFVFDHAWKYQNLLTVLQDDINGAIFETITAVSSVLETSTAETLKQYEDHMKDVQNVYIPMLDSLSEIKPGDCKKSAEGVLDQTTTFTGFAASNCANNYDTRVRAEIAKANKALVGFDDIYSQVQTIVVKGFIGQNAFLTPKEIGDKITEIYELVKGRWGRSKPDLEAVRGKLAAAIGDQNTELVRCHKLNLQNAVKLYAMFGKMVQTCIDFDNTQNPLGQAAIFAQNVEPYIEQFEAALASAEIFVWKA